MTLHEDFSLTEPAIFLADSFGSTAGSPAGGRSWSPSVGEGDGAPEGSRVAPEIVGLSVTVGAAVGPTEGRALGISEGN